jgi:hypothetical protein
LGKSNPVNLNTADIDTHVTDEAMDVLFKMVATVEKKSAPNRSPARVILLQKVFGPARK